MQRRGFLGIFGGATAAAFVPFVVPESVGTGYASPETPAVPALVPKPPKGKKVWMFGSIYSKLRIQITPTKAVQFYEGRYWTRGKEVADAVRAALDIGFTHPMSGSPPEPYGWELTTADDLARLQAAAAARRA